MKDRIEEVVRHFTDSLSPELDEAREEIKKSLRAGAGTLLQKMALVTREEYEVQTRLLERLRARVTELERRLAEFEERRSDNRSHSE